MARRKSYRFGTRSTGEFKTKKPPPPRRRGQLAVIIFIAPKEKRVRA